MNAKEFQRRRDFKKNNSTIWISNELKDILNKLATDECLSVANFLNKHFAIAICYLVSIVIGSIPMPNMYLLQYSTVSN